MHAALNVDLHFDPLLAVFVHDLRITKALREKTSVKDVIESCGVPHTEVDAIVIKQRSEKVDGFKPSRFECGSEVDFRYVIASDATVRVFGFPAAVKAPLQRRDVTTFVADGHLGKLVRRLRVLGIDVLYDNHATDAQLVAISHQQDRALLTRDRRLLMRAAVGTGYWLRSQFADEQAAEVIARFDLRNAMRPFTRCANCNGELQRVAKEDVLDQLEPLTKIYYNDFRRCRECGQVYWAGSHTPKLALRLVQFGVQRSDALIPHRDPLPAGEEDG